MMKLKENRVYTLMLIPERTREVRSIKIPTWALRSLIGFAVVVLGLVVLGIFNYAFVLSQLNDNYSLRAENRRLKGQLQVFKVKLGTLEESVDRIQNFRDKLKVITGSESTTPDTNPSELPNAAENIGKPAREIPAVKSMESSYQQNDPEKLEFQRAYTEIDQQIIRATAQALQLESGLQNQYASLMDQRDFLNAKPTRKPVVGYYTSGFGVRRSPVGGRLKMHEGLDIANFVGSPIQVTADGIVIYATVKAGYGQTVIVDHGYGIQTWYAHTKKILVRRGQKVSRGDIVAQLGNSGQSTGPHVHYEIRVNGIPVDPLSYILED